MRYIPLEEHRAMRSLTIAALVILIAFWTSAACHAAIQSSSISRPAATQRPTISQLIDGIVTRSAELNYITEQDSEVFAFYRNTPVKELTDTVFLSLLRRSTETRIIQQSWSDFFRLRTSNDPSGRWGELQDYLETNLSNLTIFRIPRDAPYGVQYDLYAVGLFNKTTVVGVQMFGVST